MDLPSPWEFVVLALAAWRVWHLIAEDDLTGPLRDRVAPPESKRSEFVECPYCSGAWISGAWWVAWTAWPDITVWLASLFAIMAAVVGLTILVNRVTE